METPSIESFEASVDCYGTVDAGFRDPSANGWKLIEARRSTGAHASRYGILAVRKRRRRRWLSTGCIEADARTS